MTTHITHCKLTIRRIRHVQWASGGLQRGRRCWARAEGEGQDGRSRWDADSRTDNSDECGRAPGWASCKVYSNVICHYITEAGTQQSRSTLQPMNMHTDTNQQQQQASQHLRLFLFCLYQGSWQVDLVDLFSSSLGIKHTVFLAALNQITENTFQL